MDMRTQIHSNGVSDSCDSVSVGIALKEKRATYVQQWKGQKRDIKSNFRGRQNLLFKRKLRIVFTLVHWISTRIWNIIFESVRWIQRSQSGCTQIYPVFG